MLELFILLCTITVVKSTCPEEYMDLSEGVCIFEMRKTDNFCQANAFCAEHIGTSNHFCFLIGSNNRFLSRLRVNPAAWTSVNQLLYQRGSGSIQWRDADPRLDESSYAGMDWKWEGWSANRRFPVAYFFTRSNKISDSHMQSPQKLHVWSHCKIWIYQKRILFDKHHQERWRGWTTKNTITVATKLQRMLGQTYSAHICKFRFFSFLYKGANVVVSCTTTKFKASNQPELGASLNRRVYPFMLGQFLSICDCYAVLHIFWKNIILPSRVAGLIDCKTWPHISWLILTTRNITTWLRDVFVIIFGLILLITIDSIDQLTHLNSIWYSILVELWSVGIVKIKGSPIWPILIANVCVYDGVLLRCEIRRLNATSYMPSCVCARAYI